MAGPGPRLLKPAEHGGFFRQRVGALFSGIVIVAFSMVGAEIATIARRSRPTEKGIVKATNSGFRILVFFVGSIFGQPRSCRELNGPATRRTVSAMEVMGSRSRPEIMNFIVLTAVLSCSNSGHTPPRVTRSCSPLAGRRRLRCCR